MPRIRRTEIHESIREDIKSTSRRLMSEAGTAGLSLRAIARAMDITAPAIYTYFPTLDDLITALIVDAFNGLADAMKAARDSNPAAKQRERLVAAFYAYRDWAQAHPAEYMLIYGTPIPGYTAPGDITVPVATRIFQVITEPIAFALQSGEASPKPPYDTVPEAQQDVLQALIDTTGYPVRPLAIYLNFLCWTDLYKLVMPALLGHLVPLDVDAFFRDEIERLLLAVGFAP
jgi:AcrR family transcriptional regulator